jgi:hypothetical protein
MYMVSQRMTTVGVKLKGLSLITQTTYISFVHILQLLLL